MGSNQLNQYSPSALGEQGDALRAAARAIQGGGLIAGSGRIPHPKPDSLLALQTGRVENIARHLGELAGRMNAHLTGLMGPEPGGIAENAKPHEQPGNALDALGYAVTQLEGALGYAQGQVERLERL